MNLWLVAILLLAGIVLKHTFGYRIIFDVLVAWLILWLFVFTEDTFNRTRRMEPKVNVIQAIVNRWVRKERFKDE
jgi:hypothetical protein